ncbi:DUF3597 domain-containing protein [Paraburkholderia sp. 31.1]|uniref:DUF3597 domain-containing protein n=1 Tax=Paraburkholderia sp. 31.1 TaxID=2615205 RepID=UPI00223B6F2B|nr:DUF3597 domain-containing protein [Paraburkholderia sp. 31.1]
MSLLLIRHRSVEYRKLLTQDLRYSGHLNDSASVNIWLHSEVTATLSQRVASFRPIWAVKPRVDRKSNTGLF